MKCFQNILCNPAREITLTKKSVNYAITQSSCFVVSSTSVPLNHYTGTEHVAFRHEIQPSRVLHGGQMGIILRTRMCWRPEKDHFYTQLSIKSTNLITKPNVWWFYHNWRFTWTVPWAFCLLQVCRRRSSTADRDSPRQFSEPLYPVEEHMEQIIYKYYNE